MKKTKSKKMLTTIFKTTNLLLISLLLTITSFTSTANSLDEGLLFKVSGGGLESPSYIYGTIHLICDDDFVISQETEEVLESIENLVLEIALNDPEQIQQMQMLAFHPEMKNISSILDEDDKEIVNNWLTNNFGAGIGQLGAMRPFMLSAMATMTIFPCENIESYDMYFMNYAQENNIPVAGLETAAYQIELFDKIPYEMQVEKLVEMIKDPKDDIEDLNKMVQHYKNKDLNGLMEIMMESEQYSKYFDILLNERNKNWIPVIEEQIKNKTTLIAVGVGHLPGEKGILRLLQDKGYKIEAIW